MDAASRASLDDESDAASQHTARASLATTAFIEQGTSTGADMMRSQSVLSSTADSFTDAQSHLGYQSSQGHELAQEHVDVNQAPSTVDRQQVEAEAVQASVPLTMPNPVMPLSGQPQQAYTLEKQPSSRSLGEKRLSGSEGTINEKERRPSEAKLDVPEGPDLSHLTPEQQKILLDQSVSLLPSL